MKFELENHWRTLQHGILYKRKKWPVGNIIGEKYFAKMKFELENHCRTLYHGTL